MEIKAELSTQARLAYSPLQQKRGFFIHLMHTYPCIMPFLKGMHMTLDGWRGAAPLRAGRVVTLTPIGMTMSRNPRTRVLTPLLSRPFLV
jgi:hypothetical protein